MAFTDYPADFKKTDKRGQFESPILRHELFLRLTQTSQSTPKLPEKLGSFVLSGSTEVQWKPVLNPGTSPGISSEYCGYIDKAAKFEGTVALTDTEIKRAKSKDKPYKLSDGKNLFLWITPSGGKLWRWAYRHEGKEKLMTFGRYAEVSLALARERHLGARTLLAAGIDPMAERKAVKSAAQVADESSFATLAGRWMEHWQQGKSARHVDSVRRRMAADILPRLGARSIAEINSSHLS